MFGFRIQSRPNDIRCSFRLTALYTFALHFYFCKENIYYLFSPSRAAKPDTSATPGFFKKKSNEMSQLINSFKLRPIFGTPMQEWDVRRIIELLTKGNREGGSHVIWQKLTAPEGVPRRSPTLVLTGP